ncbi:MAG: hypothetical protein ACLUD2_14910 [Clostridium sp.]
MELWRYVLPLQVICLILSYLIVIPLAKLERKNGAGMTEEEFKALKATLNQPVETKVSMKVICFDIILTVAILIAMLSGVVKSNLGFMVVSCSCPGRKLPESEGSDKESQRCSVVQL